MASRVQELRNQHGEPSERAQKKITDYLTEDVSQFIMQSPFAVLSTSDSEGNCDASPRGGKPGFVKIIDDKTLLMPDIRGNRLLQSTSNIISNPKAGLIFLVPGNNKSVRVNGSVQFIDIKEIKKLGANNDVFNPDETAEMIQGLLITVNESYRHCPRALSFSNLWNL
ncbi:MAG: pyridoxamine 5'-phosphate oxidase family protein [Vicingaceae bacterium]|nr:pyridoxamine 5'-phosphate oxidase family protein [Vicingaceae bacterium]